MREAQVWWTPAGGQGKEGRGQPPLQGSEASHCTQTTQWLRRENEAHRGQVQVLRVDTSGGGLQLFCFVMEVSGCGLPAGAGREHQDAEKPDGCRVRRRAVRADRWLA